MKEGVVKLKTISKVAKKKKIPPPPKLFENGNCPYSFYEWNFYMSVVCNKPKYYHYIFSDKMF